MSAALQKVEPRDAALSPRMGRAMIVADALQQESDQRELLGKYIRAHMVEGTDYGVVPGTSNKTLLKPGAEKLTQLYRCIPRFTIEEKIEQWDTGLFYYRFSCQVVTQADDAIVAEGVGSCSTYESRYRWRNQDRKCPECGREAIKRSKYPPKDGSSDQPGWYCFGKAGGCGANFDCDDPDITNQKTGRVQNPDLLDQVNTVLKMAKKRALVDAAIALARCSDIFTQDLEDHVQDAEVEQPKRHEPARPKLADAYAAEIANSGTLDQLRAVVDRINADTKDKLTKADTAVLMPLVAARKAALSPAPVPAPAPQPAPPPDDTFPLDETSPAVGAMFAAWVDATDADFAARNLCSAGAVKARLMEAGAKVGITGGDWENWNRSAIDLAERTVAEFEALLQQPELLDVKAELGRTRKKWGQCVTWLNARWDTNYTPNTKLYEVRADQLADLAADLKTHPAAEKAGVA